MQGAHINSVYKGRQPDVMMAYTLLDLDSLLLPFSKLGLLALGDFVCSHLRQTEMGDTAQF